MVVNLLLGGLEHFKRHDFQIALFKASYDFTYEPFADTVRLYQDEGFFSFELVYGHVSNVKGKTKSVKLWYSPSANNFGCPALRGSPHFWFFSFFFFFFFLFP